MRDVILYATDTMADWEYAYLTAGLAMAAEEEPDRFRFRALGDGSSTVTTKGRLRVQTDGDLDDAVIDDVALLVLPGADTWLSGHERALDLARQLRLAGRPVAAIINTHWHLDHSGGNAEIRAAFPRAEVYASHAVDGALTGFFPPSRKSAEEFLASGQASPELEAEIRRDFAAMDDVESLRATRPVTTSGEVRLAGRRLQLNLARFAALGLHSTASGWRVQPA